MTERSPDHPIDPVFLERWSPRAFKAEAMPEADLLSVLEAARWAPSAYNHQPWRFLYARRDDAHWQDFLDLLDRFNASWAGRASALIFLLSDTLVPGSEPGAPKASPTHSLDAGAAWAQLALQATRLGYQAHGMAGIDFDQSRRQLNVPNQFRIEMAIAVGRRADPAILPAELQARERPSQRLPLRQLAFSGTFPR